MVYKSWRACADARISPFALISSTHKHARTTVRFKQRQEKRKTKMLQKKCNMDIPQSQKSDACNVYNQVKHARKILHHTERILLKEP